MEHHNILVLEGGGAKGPIHIGELEVVEDRLKHKLVDFIDLFATTSIGGVEASVYATGRLSVTEFWEFLEPNLKKIFSSRFPWSVPRFDWKNYVKLYKKYVGTGIKFGDVKSKFMFTTVNLINGRNHFPKSWHPDFAELSMPLLVHRTFAAPFFFGGDYDERSHAIWSDGGVGFFNLPLMEAYAQALTFGWLEEGHKTHILALGTGRKEYRLDMKKEFKKGPIRRAKAEVQRFMSKDSGGMARAVSAMTQINTLRKIMRGHSNLSFQWVDWCPMPKKLDKMANWKERITYYDKGRELGLGIDIQPFQNKLGIKKR